MKNRANHLITVCLIAALFAGLSLLLYPTVSDYWNSFHQSRSIVSYNEEVSQISDEDYRQLWQSAQAYNQSLAYKAGRFLMNDEERAEYKSLLKVTDSGIMAYIEIPRINCSLPVYHGTDEVVLQVAVGHMEGSSLPVGGESTHCVLSGHRGLPSARLFTDLDKLEIGDNFMLNILDETLTYEVDQIRIVQPVELSALAIEEGKDYCTLLTCTPYGINTERLLVRGHRVENLMEERTTRVTADAMQIEPVMVAPVLAAPVLAVLLLILLLPKRKKRDRGDNDEALYMDAYAMDLLFDDHDSLFDDRIGVGED